ncbi:antiviral innate immune response receptor RIG-I-like [Biomphalaria glabrata]|uniref:RNA helicase n=1 Tax=Biomphalaria glabrata TaxID=6526 RepID=A0A9W2YSJ9_BIOGL|nr:antiviral innate immune response receptor RIG-I-like [Biomphalaria glabrata]
MGELGQIIHSLGDTFITYLKPEAFINWFTSLHSGVPCDKLENVLKLIGEDETAINEFTRILSSVTTNEELQHNVLLEANKDTRFEGFYLKYIPFIINGRLTAGLNLDDYNHIAKMLHKEKLILDKNLKICCSQQSESDFKRELFKSIKRKKPHWPFVFIEIIKQKRSDIFKRCRFEIENILNEDRAEENLYGDYNMPESASYISYSSNSTSLDSDDFSLSSNFDYDLDESSNISEEGFHIHASSQLKASVNFEQIINSGALSEDAITQETQRKVQDWKLKEESQFSDEDRSNSDDSDSSDSDDSAQETLPLNLRGYQEELAEKALESYNTIICAPTGSGKTKVAMHIILSHLQTNNDKRKKKVVFLAKTVPLVIQQFSCIKKHLPEPFQSRFLIGGGEDSTNLHLILPDIDIVVMTPKILENHLKKKHVFLHQFTMLIFDECHHTCRGEPYNNLMLKYIKIKHSTGVFRSLPQVIGLTASIGIGKADTDELAVKSIMEICGNLDAVHVAIVQKEKNKEELEKLVPTPHEMLFRLIDHDLDVFVLQVISFFFDLEMKLSEYCKKAGSKWLDKHMEKLNSTLKRSSQHYGQWAVTIRNIAKLLPRTHNEEKHLIVRYIIVIAEFLIAYNNALEVHSLIHLKNAMEYLEKRLEKYKKNEKPTSVEKHCLKSFESLKSMVRNQPNEENLNLINLKKALVDCMTEESRGIIFVRTRALAYALKKWLNEQKELHAYKAMVFTGSSAPPDKGGMSQITQKNIIEKFKKGDIRLLVATSVAEEGLDIPECNVVIKYNHIGNEVTTIQIRGRCRKAGGVSILLATNTIYDKEILNQKKTELMKLAIELVALKDVVTMHEKNLEYQKSILAEELKKKETKNQKREVKTKHFEMTCHLCGKLRISSDMIRTINGSHRVIIDRDIWNVVKIRGTDGTKTFGNTQKIGAVHCMSDPENETFCFNKLGSLMIYHGACFVALGIENFSVEAEDKIAFFQKWKAMPYFIQELSEEDLKQYCPAKKIDTDNDETEEDSVDNDNSQGEKPQWEEELKIEK